MKRCTEGTTMTRAKLGEQRCFWSMRIYEALRRNGLSASFVGTQLGISEAAVCMTIRGKNHSARVLDYLRSAGVPERFLFDPRRAEIEGVETATSHNRKVA